MIATVVRVAEVGRAVASPIVSGLPGPLVTRIRCLAPVIGATQNRTPSRLDVGVVVRQLGDHLEASRHILIEG